MTVPLRAALYLRVSTARQAEHDVSIPDQKRQGETYCASRERRVSGSGSTAAAIAATISARSPSGSRLPTARSASSARKATCFRRWPPRPTQSRLRPAFAVLF